MLHILDCVSNLWICRLVLSLFNSTTPQLYIILEKSDIMTDAVSLDSDFLGKLRSVIAAIMPDIYNAGLDILIP